MRKAEADGTPRNLLDERKWMAKALEGKTAIVTGSSRGIGAAIARRIAGDGARVIVNYAKRAGAADEVVKTIVDAGGKASAVGADVSTSAGIRQLFDESEKAYGGTDILINNAGAILYKLIADTSEEEFDQLFAVNV